MEQNRRCSVQRRMVAACAVHPPLQQSMNTSQRSWQGLWWCYSDGATFAAGVKRWSCTLHTKCRWDLPSSPANTGFWQFAYMGPNHYQILQSHLHRSGSWLQPMAPEKIQSSVLFSLHAWTESVLRAGWAELSSFLTDILMQYKRNKFFKNIGKKSHPPQFLHLVI